MVRKYRKLFYRVVRIVKERSFMKHANRTRDAPWKNFWVFFKTATIGQISKPQHKLLTPWIKSNGKPAIIQVIVDFLLLWSLLFLIPLLWMNAPFKEDCLPLTFYWDHCFEGASSIFFHLRRTNHKINFHNSLNISLEDNIFLVALFENLWSQNWTQNIQNYIKTKNSLILLY